MRHFFTADLHLGHRAIVEHCHRPFTSIEEHDAALIEAINHSVDRADLLYILGDFSLGNAETVARNRAAIRCRNVYLVRGNHDRLSAAGYAAAGFIYKGDLLDMKAEGQHVTLCHYAMRRWNKCHYGAWHLFGHSHGHLADDPTLFAFDIGVDCHSFRPLSFAQVRDKMLDRPRAYAQQNHSPDIPARDHGATPAARQQS